MKTEEINSEEDDVFKRKLYFDEISKRLKAHRQKTPYYKGTDLRFNIYLKKLGKMVTSNLGISTEAYK